MRGLQQRRICKYANGAQSQELHTANPQLQNPETLEPRNLGTPEPWNLETVECYHRPVSVFKRQPDTHMHIRTPVMIGVVVLLVIVLSTFCYYHIGAR